MLFIAYVPLFGLLLAYLVVGSLQFAPQFWAFFMERGIMNERSFYFFIKFMAGAPGSGGSRFGTFERPESKVAGMGRGEPGERKNEQAGSVSADALKKANDRRSVEARGVMAREKLESFLTSDENLQLGAKEFAGHIDVGGLTDSYVEPLLAEMASDPDKYSRILSANSTIRKAFKEYQGL